MSSEMQHLEKLEQQVTNLDKKMGNMDTNVQELQEDVRKILFLLKGDKELNPENKGFVEEFNELKKEVAKLNQLKTKVIWWAIGAGPTSVGLFELIRRFITKL